MTEALLSWLRGRRVLLAYGLAGEAVQRLRPIGFDYMGTQLAWLRACGAEAQVVPLPTAAAVADNATLLAGAILARREPCLLVGHSKGGLEALDALLRPGVAAHCEGLVTLQTPFWGSPVADMVVARPGLHGAARGLARVLGAGSGAGVADLTTTARAAWMAVHRDPLRVLTARLPVLAIGSHVRRESAVGPDRRYLPLAEWLERRGAGWNDGLVPVSSALLPGARHQVLNGSHRALVSSGEGRDPLGVLRRALISLGPPPSAATRLPSAS